jgi:hypothetical protein
MSVDLVRIQTGPIDISLRKKKPGPRLVPVLSWLVARKKIEALTRPERNGSRVPEIVACHAVRRGRIVKSRNWVRMLDICIPLSCETNGRISATNWSFTSSLISS